MQERRLKPNKCIIPQGESVLTSPAELVQGLQGKSATLHFLVHHQPTAQHQTQKSIPVMVQLCKVEVCELKPKMLTKDEGGLVWRQTSNWVKRVYLAWHLLAKIEDKGSLYHLGSEVLVYGQQV